MLEKQIEAEIKEYAESRGCLFLKFTSPSNRGVPDRIVVGPSGEVGFLEIKRLGGKVSALQRRMIGELCARYCDVLCVYSVEQGKQFIDALLA